MSKKTPAKDQRKRFEQPERLNAADQADLQEELNDDFAEDLAHLLVSADDFYILRHIPDEVISLTINFLLLGVTEADDENERNELARVVCRILDETDLHRS